jgi:hypothetical protein
VQKPWGGRAYGSPPLALHGGHKPPAGTSSTAHSSGRTFLFFAPCAYKEQAPHPSSQLPRPRPRQCAHNKSTGVARSERDRGKERGGPGRRQKHRTLKEGRPEAAAAAGRAKRERDRAKHIWRCPLPPCLRQPTTAPPPPPRCSPSAAPLLSPRKPPALLHTQSSTPPLYLCACSCRRLSNNGELALFVLFVCAGSGRTRSRSTR